MPGWLTLLRVSTIATAVEHAALAALAAASVVLGGRPLPLLSGLAMPVTAQVACACLLATTLTMSLASVVPGADDIPRPPQPAWAAARVGVAVAVTLGGMLAGAALAAGDPAATEVLTALTRNAAALGGVALAAGFVHRWLGLAAPWLWFAACLLWGVPQGQPAAWAIPLEPAEAAWAPALALLACGWALEAASEHVDLDRRRRRH